VRLTSERSRRADILAAAEREFGVAGFAGGRVERIAAQARVNKQLIFHYFDSKDGLFLAALERLLARFAVPEDGPTPAERLRLAVRRIQAAAQGAPGVLGTLAAVAEGSQTLPPGAVERLQTWRHEMLGRLRETVADGQRRGYFRDDIDPAAVATATLGAALGLAAIGAPTGAGDLFSDYCAWR
jgi:TetR/AcrR family transcriptional regulator